YFSVQVYDHVEALDYGQAHQLSAIMLVLAFLVLVALYSYHRKTGTPGFRVLG
ncbi:MAG: molybdate ABC transporter permease subunit, partial [Proteobacteria bacterium]|nr:molybdate ABC transporter permease subunit [Pseudomonadota bacterium]